MSQSEEKNFKIVFQKVEQLSHEGDEILIISQEVAQELETNDETLKELSLLAKTKQEADQSYNEINTKTVF